MTSVGEFRRNLSPYSQPLFSIFISVLQVTEDLAGQNRGGQTGQLSQAYDFQGSKLHDRESEGKRDLLG